MSAPRFARMVEKARSGGGHRLLFLIPPNNKRSGPMYELILMTDAWLRTEGVRGQVHISWTTFEEICIQAFAPRLNTVVAEEFKARDHRPERLPCEPRRAALGALSER